MPVKSTGTCPCSQSARLCAKRFTTRWLSGGKNSVCRGRLLRCGLSRKKPRSFTTKWAALSPEKKREGNDLPSRRRNWLISAEDANGWHPLLFHWSEYGSSHRLKKPISCRRRSFPSEPIQEWSELSLGPSHR